MKPYYHDERSGITIYHGDCREILPHVKAVAWSRIRRMGFPTDTDTVQATDPTVRTD